MEQEETFELALTELESAVAKLEDGSLTLEEALTTFESGVRWSRTCRQFLEKAEQRIDLILKNDKGEYTQTAFDLERCQA
jgi:exodeoxyribonuclease VII small subunit